MDRSLTAEAAAQLHEGINLLLSRWTALRMAIENEWGGRDSLQKSQQLGEQLFDIFTKSKEQVYIEDLEEMLETFMDRALYTVIDDGSIEEISLNLMLMHEECLEGKFDSIRKLRESNPPSVSYVRQTGNNDDEDSSDDDDDEPSEMEVDTPKLEANTNVKKDGTRGDTGKEAPAVEDGWTVVSSRRNKGRKN